MSELTRTELRRVADEFKSERDAAKSATLRAFDERDILLNENAALRNERDALAERVEKLERALERIIGMCDCPDGDTGRCGNCGRPNGIPAVVSCAESALALPSTPHTDVAI